MKDAICLFSFSNLAFGFHPRSSTKVKIIQFENRDAEENFVVNNKVICLGTIGLILAP